MFSCNVCGFMVMSLFEPCLGQITERTRLPKQYYRSYGVYWREQNERADYCLCLLSDAQSLASLRWLVTPSVQNHTIPSPITVACMSDFTPSCHLHDWVSYFSSSPNSSFVGSPFHIRPMCLSHLRKSISHVSHMNNVLLIKKARWYFITYCNENTFRPQL